MSADLAPDSITGSELADQLLAKNQGEDKNAAALAALPTEEQSVGHFKFKDRDGRRGFVIANPRGGLMIIKEIRLYKTPNSNNQIDVSIIVPDPKQIEVSVKKGAKG